MSNERPALTEWQIQDIEKQRELLRNAADYEQFRQRQRLRTEADPPNSYPAYATLAFLESDGKGGYFSHYNYLYVNDLTAMIAAVGEAFKDTLGGLPIERAGWIVPHPITGQPVEVITKDWAEQELQSAEARLALATAGAIRLRLKSDGTDKGTQLVDILSGREVDGAVSLYIAAKYSDESPVTVTANIELYGLDLRGPVFSSNREDGPKEITVKGDAANPGEFALALHELDIYPVPPPEDEGDRLSVKGFQFAVPGAMLDDDAESDGDAQRPYNSPIADKPAFILTLVTDAEMLPNREATAEDWQELRVMHRHLDRSRL